MPSVARRPSPALRLRADEQLVDAGRYDPPGDPTTILQPAALAPLAILRQPLPIVVDLFLGIAFDHEGHRLIELELRSAVEGEKSLPSSSNSTVMAIPASRGPPVWQRLTRRIRERGNTEVSKRAGSSASVSSQRLGTILDRMTILVRK